METTKPKRRWFRYSLRTFLLLLTVLCIWMGMTAAKAIRQKRAIEAITAIGGEVRFDYDELAKNQTDFTFRPDGEPSGPAWLRKIIGDDYFRVVVGVGFSNGNLDDATVIKMIEPLPDLKYLHVASTNVTDNLLPRIATLRNLTALDLNCPQLTVEGLKQLKPLPSLACVFSLRDGAQRTMNNLKQPTDIEMNETPLPDVIQFLRDKYNLPVEFDSSLDQVDLEMLLVTATLNGDDLGTALEKILASHKLGFFVRGKQIVITTAEASAKSWAGKTLLRQMFPNASVEVDW
jgi:hypothetical protein